MASEVWTRTLSRWFVPMSNFGTRFSGRSIILSIVCKCALAARENRYLGIGHHREIYKIVSNAIDLPPLINIEEHPTGFFPFLSRLPKLDTISRYSNFFHCVAISSLFRYVAKLCPPFPRTAGSKLKYYLRHAIYGVLMSYRNRNVKALYFLLYRCEITAIESTRLLR